MTLIAADKEKWGMGHPNFVTYIWEGRARKGAPDGFLTFHVHVKPNRKGKIREVLFEAELAYIRRAKRRRGLGSMLAADIGMRLEGCRVRPPTCDQARRERHILRASSRSSKKCRNATRMGANNSL